MENEIPDNKSEPNGSLPEEETEEKELDGIFGFGIMCVDNGVFQIKELPGYVGKEGEFIPFDYFRAPTTDDLVTTVSLLAKKFEREALAKEIVDMIRSTPGKIIVPKSGPGFRTK